MVHLNALNAATKRTALERKFEEGQGTIPDPKIAATRRDEPCL
jgi:hypothetical protein